VHVGHLHSCYLACACRRVAASVQHFSSSSTRTSEYGQCSAAACQVPTPLPMTTSASTYKACACTILLYRVECCQALCAMPPSHPILSPHMRGYKSSPCILSTPAPATMSYGKSSLCHCFIWPPLLRGQDSSLILPYRVQVPRDPREAELLCEPPDAPHQCRCTTFLTLPLLPRSSMSSQPCHAGAL
jgi:hypothetical protein